VTEIETGDDGFFPSFFVAAPGGVYFVAGDPTHGRELWWSDGTSAGTHLSSTCNLGPLPYYNGRPQPPGLVARRGPWSSPPMTACMAASCG
jgi:ELWxxDGT repeat protein